jgi:phosphohistidine swiveling domain-containing protein
MQAKSDFIVPLSDASAALSRVGGKGASLARLAAAGLPVPSGFHITTAAYRRFVVKHELQERILAAVSTAAPDQPAVLEEASSRIGQLFAQSTMPEDIAEAIRRAYDDLGAYAGLGEGDVPVAVRSSATAEELPEMSFAGQQETYLNIRGAEAVLEAVKKCWASLWTAQAIGYRARHHIAPQDVSLAVVVQVLVPADAAGILFTANPLTGARDQVMINAAWGLGEAIVGGHVTPDTVVVDKASGKVVEQKVSKKDVMTVRTLEGTREEAMPKNRRDKAVLSPAQAAELTQIGLQIEELYGQPMDIEWALHDGRISIVQARPITALPDPPLEWKSPYPKPLLAHGDSIDLAPDAVSPLFATLGIPIANKVYLKMYDKVMGLRGEDVPIFVTINGYIYLCFVKGSKFWKYMSVHATTVGRLYAYGLERAEELRTTSRTVVTKWRQVDLASVKAPELLAGVRELFEVAADYFYAAICRPIPQSNFSELFFSRFYNALIKRKEDPAATAFLLGLESLPLRAEKSLFDLAQWAKAQPELAEALARMPADEIWAELQSDPVPAPLAGEFAARFTAHLEGFGHVLYDLDFMNPVPAEEPVPMLDALKAYLAGQGTNPYSRQGAQERQRQQAELTISRRTGPLRRKWFQKLLTSAQECASKREDAIANIGLPYPQLRRLLRELGLRLAAGGAIVRSDDIYWLEAQEVDALAVALEKKQPLSSHAAIVEPRKANWKRARMAVPPTVMPENAFLAKMAAPKKPSQPNLLSGYGASAGTVTAPACVLRSPEDFGQMRPGDVIVAMITTPAWTPLFAAASAVVTDIGGPLSHGSIVAREYGIPAVMDTRVATRLIHTGQIITVDGSAGTVTLKG